MPDHTPDAQRLLDESYESDLTEEESERLLLLCGHGIGPELSPAAQAVLDAFLNTPGEEPMTGWNYGRDLAAALRAAADQCAEGATHWELYAIAAELEGTQ